MDGPNGARWAVWRTENTRLVGKRIDDQTFQQLVDYVRGAGTLPSNFGIIEADPSATATVYTTTCLRDGVPISIEVVTGDLPARLSYVLGVDPLRLTDDGSTITVIASTQPVDDIQTSPISAAEWRTLLATTWPTDDLHRGVR